MAARTCFPCFPMAAVSRASLRCPSLPGQLRRILSSEKSKTSTSRKRRLLGLLRRRPRLKTKPRSRRNPPSAKPLSCKRHLLLLRPSTRQTSRNPPILWILPRRRLPKPNPSQSDGRRGPRDLLPSAPRNASAKRPGPDALQRSPMRKIHPNPVPHSPTRKKKKTLIKKSNCKKKTQPAKAKKNSAHGLRTHSHSHTHNSFRFCTALSIKFCERKKKHRVSVKAQRADPSAYFLFFFSILFAALLQWNANAPTARRF